MKIEENNHDDSDEDEDVSNDKELSIECMSLLCSTISNSAAPKALGNVMDNVRNLLHQQVIIIIAALSFIVILHHHIILLIHISSMLHLNRLICYITCFYIYNNVNNVNNNNQSSCVILHNAYSSWNVLFLYWNGIKSTNDNETILLFNVIVYAYWMLSIGLFNLTPNTNHDNDNAANSSMITWKVAMLIVFVLSQQWYYVMHMMSIQVFHYLLDLNNELSCALVNNKSKYDDHDDNNKSHDTKATHAMEISIAFWIAYYYYYDHVDNKKDIILFCTSFLPFWINETHLLYNLHMHHAKLSTSSSSIANNYQLTCVTTTTATPVIIGLCYHNLLNYYDRLQYFTNFHYHDCYCYCKDLYYHTTISINTMQLVATHHDRNRSCYDLIRKHVLHCCDNGSSNMLVVSKVKDDSSCVHVSNFVSAEYSNIISNGTTTNVATIAPLACSKNDMILGEEHDDTINKKKSEFFGKIVDANDDGPNDVINSAATTADDTTASTTATTTMSLSSLQRSHSINEDDAIDDKGQHNDIIGNDNDGTEDDSDMGKEQSTSSSDNNTEQIDETKDSITRQDNNNEKKKDLLQNIKENYIIEHQPEIESTFTIINPDDDRNEDKFQDVHVMSMNETFITSSNQEVRTQKRSKKDKVLKWMNKKFYT